MKYYHVNKKYLAEALSFLGFRYFKYNDPNGSVMYTFEDTDLFRDGLNELLKIKKKIRSKQLN